MLHGVPGMCQSTVYTLFHQQALWNSEKIAVIDGDRRITYSELLIMVDRLAAGLRDAGMRRGDRVAMLSENRTEYLQLHLAAARLGIIVACLNWRFSESEIRYCIDLVTPSLLLHSGRFSEIASRLRESVSISEMDIFWDQLPAEGLEDVDYGVTPEDGLLLLYTSGTTGFPKAALISQRAEIARMTVFRMDLGIDSEDTYLAWAPMFHMGGTEHSLSTLMHGGTVVVCDGFKLDTIVDVIRRYRLGWLLLVPATIQSLIDTLRKERVVPAGVKIVGCMPDMIPIEQIVEISRRLGAPFLNSYGSTETGLPPATVGVLSSGEAPQSLSKRISSLCELKLVGTDGMPVVEGGLGEAWVRGPTLFSGYWGMDEDTKVTEDNSHWYRTGDLLRRNHDNTVDFVGRAKYLIKSGGENIYPAEIERVLLMDPRVQDVAVVRMRDDHWGEVPVACVVKQSSSLTEEDINTLCRDHLGSYKRPRAVLFLQAEDLPRSTTGKVVRETLEEWVEQKLSGLG